MSESRKHHDGVEALRRIITARYAGRRDMVLSIDTPDTDRHSKPPLVGGFRPDIYAKTWLDGEYVIGEAKTARDLRSERSSRQIGAFLKDIRESVRGYFMLAVPFAVESEGVALLQHLSAGNEFLRCRIGCVAIEEHLIGPYVEALR